MFDSIITMECESPGPSRTQDIFIKISGVKLEALLLQLNGDERVRLGKPPVKDTSIISTQNYIADVLNYIIRLSELARRAQYRKAEDYAYNKIRNLVYSTNDVETIDIQDIIKTFDIVKTANK